MPELDDYDREKHTYDESYVHPGQYAIGVSACGGVTNILDREDAERVIDEVERERWQGPGGGDPVRPGERAPSVNVGGRQQVNDDIVAWHWTVEDTDGEVVSRTTRRANLGPESCGATVRVPGPGRYRVHLRLEMTTGDQTASERFQLRDRLIVSIGDSYASGQGVPDERAQVNFTGNSPNICREGIGWAKFVSVPVNREAVWLEPKAHRSLTSGPFRAAQTVQSRIDGDLVTFLPFAASGATIDEGLLGPQHDWQAVGQVEEAKRAVGNRSIDALLVSIGGNDVGFASGLRKLVLDLPRGRKRPTIERRTREEITRLEGRFEQLADAIDDLDVEDIFVTEYPLGLFDVDDDGTVGSGCGVFNVASIAKISKTDAEAIKDMGRALNAAIEDAAAQHGWTYVDGIVDRFRGKGYCRSDERFFVTASESCETQGDFDGTMHPNRTGQRAYGEAIAGALREGPFRPPPRSRDHRTRDEGRSRADGTRRDSRSGHEGGDSGSRARPRGEERRDVGTRDRERTPARRGGSSDSDGTSGSNSGNRATDRDGTSRDHREHRK